MTDTQIRPVRASVPQHRPEDLSNITDIADVIPWDAHDRISLRPFRGHWSMNPSVHFDGEVWRCAIRCADHANPDGQSIRGEGASKNFSISKNAMLILDPTTFDPIQCFVMNEDDGWPRVQGSTSRGYEDIRLFQTPDGGIQGIAASLDLERGVGRKTGGGGGRFLRVGGQSRSSVKSRDRSRVIAQGSQEWIERPGIHPPEQVLLSFDEEYNIIDARPLRGPWSATPQKNWSPFDRAEEPLFLFSIDQGRVFGSDGPLDGEWNPKAKKPLRYLRNAGGGTEIRTVRQPVKLTSSRGLASPYKGLRGGTQLCYVGDRLDERFGREIEGGAWIALCHDMVLNYEGSKLYWHLVYAVDSTGEMVGISEPIKLAPDKGIEYAAGLAIDGDRAVISYGVDDMECWIGVTTTDALLSLIVPLEDDTIDVGGAPSVNGSNGHGTRGANAWQAGDHDPGDVDDNPIDDTNDEPSEPAPPATVPGWIATEATDTVPEGKIPVIGRRRRPGMR